MAANCFKIKSGVTLQDDARTSSSEPVVADSLSDSGSWVLIEDVIAGREDDNENKDLTRKLDVPLSNKSSEPSKRKLLIRDWPKLFDTVREKNEEKLESLLKKEAAFPSFGKETLETKGADGSTLLYQSVLEGQVGIAKLLLEYRADPNETRGRWPRESCLQQATLLGRQNLVELLLDHGANVLLEDGTYQSALHAAAGKGNISLACLLLKRGANVNQKGSKLVTPLAIAVENTQLEMMEFLVAQGADVKMDKKALEIALKRDHIGMVEFLFKNGAASKLSPTELGLMLIDRARSGKEPKVVAALLEHGASAGAENGEPLELAIDRFDQNPIVGLLLDHGADPKLKRSPYNYEKTMEERALHTGNPMLVEVFLEKGLGTRTRKDVLKEYLLYCAALPDGMGHKIVKYLINHGASGNLKTAVDYPASGTMMSPLQWAAYNSDLEMVKARLEKGDDVEGLSVCHTPLQYAAMNGNEDIARVLLSHGARVNHIGQHRFGKLVRPEHTPLQLAVDRRHFSIAKLLLESGGDANLASSAVSPLGAAAKRGDVAFIDLLLDHGARPLLSDSYSADPLFNACWTGNRKIVEKLLGGNFTAEEMRTLGIKALHAAGEKGHLEIMRMLLEKGGDINGWWAQQNLLFAATKEGNENMVRLLVEKGANPNAKGNANGMSAMQKAIETYDEDLIDALR
jgi:ankyrin repeat protein